MGERIRQFFLSILGIATCAFIFFLVFKDNKRFMIIFLISLGALVVIILLVGLILRIKDNADAKRRTRPYKR